MHLPLHLHFAFVFAFWNRQITLQSGIQDINTAFRASKAFSYAFAFAFAFCICICLLKLTNHASKRHSRDKCRIYGIKTFFLCICQCICILPLYLPSEIDKITLQSGIQDINTAFRASKTFSYAFAFAFAFCLCICLLKFTNHASKRHSWDKCRI